MKRTLLLFLAVCLYSGLFAQKYFKPGKDTLMYYMNYADKPVADNSLAQYVLVIMPPDSTTGVKLYPVAKYYINNKPEFFGYSKTKDYDSLVFEGPYVSYDRDGYKEEVMNYSNGIPKGNLTLYFSNGKPYADEFYKDNGDLLLVNCWGLNGNALAKDGNGLWVTYSFDFKHVIRKGMVKDSLEEGIWYEKLEGRDDTTVFNKGKVVSTNSISRKLGVCFDPQKTAKFQGDFGAYLSRTIRYPAKAKEKNQKGKVSVFIVIDKDGSVIYANAMESSGYKSLDDEAIRVLKNGPKWIPGTKNGEPVRVGYTIPISFTLSSGDY
jgi:TonB family protein